jgi:hypothetical protein
MKPDRAERCRRRNAYRLRSRRAEAQVGAEEWSFSLTKE